MEDIEEYGGCIIRRPDGGHRIWRLYNQEARWKHRILRLYNQEARWRT
jgi:hypothetical protein